MVAFAARPIPLAPERRNTVAARVYAELREAIVTTALKPGQRVAEAELADSLGVSRTPVREAIVRLVEEGLIEVSPQTGTRISLVGLERIRQAVFVRASLEGGAVRRPAAEPGDADLRALRRNLADQEAAIGEGDVTEMHRRDMDFHATLLASVGRPLAWNACLLVSADLARVGFLLGFDGSHLSQVLAEHRAIFASLEARDFAIAADRLESHVANIEGDRVVLSERHPEYFDPRPGA
jgi:DNA-binding GntR family transcriptional regulator